MKNHRIIYKPHIGNNCIESCISIVRSVLGYGTAYPHGIPKLDSANMPTGAPATSFVVEHAQDFFPKHEVAVWCSPMIHLSIDPTLLRYYQGSVPNSLDEVVGPFIFIFDYLTFGSFQQIDGKWYTLSHTVVGSPALAPGMQYSYILRVTVDDSRRNHKATRAPK